jgi:hypothetical protein
MARKVDTGGRVIRIEVKPWFLRRETLRWRAEGEDA